MGTWIFTPPSGIGLEAGSWVTVNVEVIAPDNPNKEFTGKVKAANSEIPYSDYCEIDVYLRTPRTRDINTLFQWFLQQFPNTFPILRQLFVL